MHLPCRGQREFWRQLHVFSGDFLGLRVLAFLLEIIFCMLCVVLYDTFTVCLFIIFDRGLIGLKHLSMSLRNSLPTLVFTAKLKGGLNQRMFLFLFFFFLFWVFLGGLK